MTNPAKPGDVVLEVGGNRSACTMSAGARCDATATAAQRSDDRAAPRKERPILFSGPMVRALLAGTKTQTRRVVKPGRGQSWLSPELLNRAASAEFIPNLGVFKHPHGGPLTCVAPPYGVPGDALWVRETWGYDWYDDGNTRAWKRPVYRADPGAQPLDNGDPMPWRPSIYMPRALSRISLRITDVRVERLNDISRADAAAEGLARLPATGRYVIARGDQYFGSASHDPREVYSWLWEDINGPGSWDKNPWVWAVTFEVTA